MVGGLEARSFTMLLLSGCLSRQAAEQHDIGPTDSSQIELGRHSACAAGSARAIALLEPNASESEHGCGVVLERGETGELTLIRRSRVDEFELPAVLARGQAPEACGPKLEWCELSGVTDKLGPLVLASVRGPESEMPIQIYLGWIDGERLLFVETWYGLPSVVDHTRIGPPWALAAFDCAGELLLLPAPRLPEAGHEAPTKMLLEFAGRWRADADGILQPPERPSIVDRGSCRALLPSLP
jgi:hypothetical protein